MTADLLMIVPSRGRPQNLASLYQAWMETQTGAGDLLVAIDEDDPELVRYLDVASAMPEVMLHTSPPAGGMVGVLNRWATQYARVYPVIGFMGDDHRPRTRGWDVALVEALTVEQASRSWGALAAVSTQRIPRTGVAYGNDLLMGEQMPTAVAMTSNIIAELGYMVPPTLGHLCADLVWADWGRGVGRLTYLRDVVIEHMHPANGKAPVDAGYERVNSPAQVTADAEAYYAYRDNGALAADLQKLEALL